MSESSIPLWKQLDPDWLRRAFIDQRMEADEIAEQHGMSRDVVYYALRQHKISVRERPPRFKTLDPQRLYHLYHELELDSKQTAVQMGTDPTTILKALRYHGIRVRGIGERPAQAKALWNDPTWLEERRRAGVTQTAMAKEAGCTVLTISRALQRHAAGESTRSTQDPVQCTDACRYFADCLDWPVDRPCPMVVERFSVKRIHPSPPDSILP